MCFLRSCAHPRIAVSSPAHPLLSKMLFLSQITYFAPGNILINATTEMLHRLVDDLVFFFSSKFGATTIVTQVIGRNEVKD